MPPGKNLHSRIRHRRHGVYILAYEDTTSPPFTSRARSLLDGFLAIWEEISHVQRLLIDTIKLAPAEFVIYMVTTVWRGIYSALNLYWLSVLCDGLEGGFMSPRAYWPLAATWLSCITINIAAERTHALSLEILIRRIRMHFIPLLIRASLRVDLLSIQDLYAVFPVEGRFGAEFPGGPFLKQLSQLVQSTLCLASQVFVLIYTIFHKRSPERKMLLGFCIVRDLIWWFAPSNGLGCSAYVYWPNNKHFRRVKTLFYLAFSTEYRANLVLDGIANAIESEYRKYAGRLGDTDPLDPTPWRVDLLRDWYWDFMMDITLDLPMVVYALVLPMYLSPSSMASMALLQHATKSISLSMRQYTEHASSLVDVCAQSKQLYDSINYQGTILRGTEPFPRQASRSYDTGMKVSFRHVSLQYPGSDRHALRNVSFDILSGEFVLVAGANGSGKSSMLKLLARLFDPTEGEIFVDDLPLVRYDVDQLRGAITFQSQSPVVYPVTVRENIAFGLRPACDVEQRHVEKAARMGGCSEWISRLDDGYDTLLQPSFDSHRGWMDGVYGYPSEALREELARHKDHLVSISDGEKQRLSVARTIMRIHNRMTRLLVVDEATSLLDPVAEREILTTFRKARAGKTIVLVTHRFHHLAHEADRILCMKDGHVVENGTHAQLVVAGGAYSALYHAQVA